jgi:hypothetical protein
MNLRVVARVEEKRKSLMRQALKYPVLLALFVMDLAALPPLVPSKVLAVICHLAVAQTASCQAVRALS